MRLWKHKDSDRIMKYSIVGTQLLLVALTLSIAPISFAAQSPALFTPSNIGDTKSKLSLIFWEAVLPYGSEEVEAPAPRAFSELGEALATINALRRATGNKTHHIEAWDDIKSEASAEDLDDLLSYDNPFFVAVPDNGKAVVLNGSWLDKESYQFSLQDTYSHAPLTQMGDTVIKLGIHKGTLSNHSAVVSTDINLNMGTLLFAEMLQSMEAFHQQLDANNSDNPAILRQHADQLPTLASELSNSDLVALAKFQASTPALLTTLLSFSHFESLIEPAMRSQKSETLAISDVNLHLKLDLKKIKSHYPKTWDSLGLFFKHASVQTTIALPDGKGNIAVFGYNAETQIISIRTQLYQGGIAITQPSSQDEESSTIIDIIYPSRLKSLSYEVSTDVAIDFYGLNIIIEDINLASQYDSSLQNQSAAEHKARLTMNLRQPPQVTAKGAFLHIVPTWLIDALIPGTIETIITEAFNQIATGNDGKGALISFEFTQTAGQHLVHMNTQLELPYPVLQSALASPRESTPVTEETVVAQTPEQMPTPEKILSPQIFDALRIAFRQDFDRVAGQYRYTP